MKLKLKLLDSGTRILDSDLPFEEKEIIYNEIYYKYKDNIEDTWENGKTKIFLCTLADFLYPYSKSNRVDKTLLSKRKLKEMNRGSKKYVNFSNLSKNEKIELGVLDLDTGYTSNEE